MPNANASLITKSLIGLAVWWIITPIATGWMTFGALAATNQLQYRSVICQSKPIPTCAIQFDYTPNSLLRYLPVAGFNSGLMIAISPKFTSRPSVTPHELRHVQQRLWFGPLFRHFYSGINQFHLLMRYSAWGVYLSNPFERDAYRYSGEQARYNELIDQHAPALSRLKLTLVVPTLLAT